MWHVSVSVGEWGGRVIPTASLSGKEARRAKAFALELLDGVGMGPDRRERFEIAFHVRRRLTPDEIRRLDPVWCQIEPVDLGGEGEPW